MNMLRYILVLFILNSSFPVFAEISWVNSSQTIRVTGNHTGDQLRNAIINGMRRPGGGGPRYYPGTVVDRIIVFDGHLEIRGTFTDNNSTYTFPSNFRFYPNGGNVTFTDVTIFYDGNAKGTNGGQSFTANWNRVKFIQGVNSGTTYFFSNTTNQFSFNDVAFTSYGTTDRLHLRTDARTLSNIKIASPSNTLNVYPGTINSWDTQILENIDLTGVNGVLAAGSTNGLIRMENLNWDNVDWFFGCRDAKFEIVNPTKPVGWIGYRFQGTAATNDLKEIYTHNVKVLAHDRSPMQNTGIYLYNEDDAAFDYTETTAADGSITEQEILYLNFNVSSTARANWRLAVASYDKEYFVQPRVFDQQITEEIILLDDQKVTHTIAQVNGFNEISNTDSLYDAAKLWKVNSANILSPSINDLLVSESVGTLYLPNNWNFIVDPMAATDFSVNKITETITIKSDRLSESSKFNKLVCRGDITLLNDAIIDFPYIDANNDSYVRILELTATDTIYFRNFADRSVIKKFVGPCGLSYKSKNENLVVELRRQNGDNALRYYDMNNTGMDNYFYMGINTIRMETMFNPTDRGKLFSTVDKLRERMEESDAELNDILSWIRAVSHQLQPNQK